MGTIFEFKVEYWIILSSIAVVYFVRKITEFKRRNIPPGPICLPIIGHLPLLYKSANKELEKLFKSYGEIYSVRIGSQLVIVLNGPDSIREMYLKKEFHPRPKNLGALMILKERLKLSEADESWDENRKFTLHSLKDLGLGQQKYEENVREEIEHILKNLKNPMLKAHELVYHLHHRISNSLSYLLYGQKYEYDNPERKLLLEKFFEAVNIRDKLLVHLFFPWILYIPFIRNRFTFEYTVTEALISIFKNEVEKHKLSLDPLYKRDFVDCYLTEMNSRLENGINTSLNDAALIENIHIFLSFGSDNLTNTILWIFLMMALFPKIQKNVQNEITDIIGQNRKPLYQDKKNLPYTSAVLLECLRWRTTDPLTILRCAADNTTLGGYDVPKNTLILFNLWAVHFDPKYWKDPHSFIPERFLSEDKLSLIRHKEFTPFGGGKRICPAESASHVTTFLFFTTVLQEFNIELRNKDKMPVLDIDLWTKFKKNIPQFNFIHKK